MAIINGREMQKPLVLIGSTEECTEFVKRIKYGEHYVRVSRPEGAMGFSGLEVYLISHMGSEHPAVKPILEVFQERQCTVINVTEEFFVYGGFINGHYVKPDITHEELEKREAARALKKEQSQQETAQETARQQDETSAIKPRKKASRLREAMNLPPEFKGEATGQAMGSSMGSFAEVKVNDANFMKQMAEAGQAMGSAFAKAASAMFGAAAETKEAQEAFKRAEKAKKQVEAHLREEAKLKAEIQAMQDSKLDEQVKANANKSPEQKCIDSLKAALIEAGGSGGYDNLITMSAMDLIKFIAPNGIRFMHIEWEHEPDPKQEIPF